MRPFTEAEDVAGFAAARGILTSEGGKASHAALVARGMGRPCVCGASELEVDVDQGLVHVNGRELRGGQMIAIDGSTGAITLDDVPLITPEISEEFRTVLDWADELRRLQVRANADTPEDSARARSFGAEGIGLCRTEHMFFGADRDRLVKEMFVAAEQWRRAEATRRRREARAGGELESAEGRFRELSSSSALQRSDFEGIFRAMRGLPVTIRLLDPPLHEFLPRGALRGGAGGDSSGGAPTATRSSGLQRSVALVRDLHEANPMLGTRGVRLAILYPPSTRCRSGRSSRRLRRRGRGRGGSRGDHDSADRLRDRARAAPRAGGEGRPRRRSGSSVPTVTYHVGTMLELPRACLIAGQIARHADFFSFGTNDLTQTAIGLSRDDVEGRFLAPTSTAASSTAARSRRSTSQASASWSGLGAERGRDGQPRADDGHLRRARRRPEQHPLLPPGGLDYVSCSPYRVPIARVAAAQAAAAENNEG